MNGLCLDCGRVNKDEALEEIKQEAKKTAIQTDTTQAIYREDGEWKFISAFTAVELGIPFSIVVSKYL
jgi:hypothetical protein